MHSTSKHSKELKKINIQLHPSNSLKGSKGNLDRLQKKAELEVTIEGNEVLSRLLGEATKQSLDNKYKNEK